MARNLLYDSFYTSHGGLVPVKWTAPEVRKSASPEFSGLV